MADAPAADPVEHEGTHVVFVTSELSPLTPGGAGAVVARLRERLIERGDQVSVILVADVEGDLPDGVAVADTAPSFEDRSRLAAEALRQLVSDERPDLIEIQDFDGLAFDVLVHRGDVGVDRVPMQIRFHGPADLMFEAIGVEPPEIAIARSMESSSYRMADRVVAPSAGIGRFTVDRYELEPDRVIVGQPPLPAPRPIVRSPGADPTLLCVGRLGEVKGTHDLVAAAVPLLREHPEAHLVLVGEDGWSATALKPMREWLSEDLIPADVADRIEIVGRLEGEALDRRVSEAWAVVVPSRFESFNLVAHEARAAGLPVIVPDLPAFSGMLDEHTGALVYDGTTVGLTDAMRTIIEDAELRERLSAAPLPTYGDPLDPYNTLPTVRHPRSQAGHATAAVKRLELIPPVEIEVEPEVEVEETPPVVEERGAIRRAASATLIALPEPAAGTVVRAIPDRWRDRLAFVFDWRQEMGRRATEAEEAAEDARIVAEIARVEAIEAAEVARLEAEDTALDLNVAGGGFPDLDQPLVTVVIPCYNDGRYLDDAIRSVFKQTMTSFEVIVVDDGSTDPATIAIIEELPWTRTRVIHQENKGLSAARNAGMSAARGTYLVPLDADDALEPTYLERMVEGLEADPEAAFAACRARLFGDIDVVWIPRPYNPYQFALSNSIVGCVLMRRDAYLAVGGYDETMRHGNEDWDLWLRLLEDGWGVVEVPEVLFRYRKHGISMSVETEARFEQGRAEIVERHPELYDRRHLASMKRDHYPLASIIVGDGAALLLDQDIDDAEVISLGGVDAAFETLATTRGWSIRTASTLDDAVRAAHGKFVVHWSGAEGVEPSALTSLAEQLETEPEVGAAQTDGEQPLVMVRRWSLFDPDAPAATAVVDATGTGEDQLMPGAFPDPDWTFPTAIDGVPVQRQRPEEEGHLPSWIV